jgi:acyl-coenzyme A thioesterase PaaI-like protein
MDATKLAAALFEPIPAHATLGIEVVRAVDGSGAVAVADAGAFANVIGAMHSSGLIALVDAASLAAIISAANSASQSESVLPLGAAASMQFLAPARGRLTARCDLTADDTAELSALYAAEKARIKIATTAEVLDATGAVVCHGSFDWSIRTRV